MGFKDDSAGALASQPREDDRLASPDPAMAEKRTGTPADDGVAVDEVFGEQQGDDVVQFRRRVAPPSHSQLSLADRHGAHTVWDGAAQQCSSPNRRLAWASCMPLLFCRPPGRPADSFRKSQLHSFRLFDNWTRPRYHRHPCDGRHHDLDAPRRRRLQAAASGSLYVYVSCSRTQQSAHCSDATDSLSDCGQLIFGRVGAEIFGFAYFLCAPRALSPTFGDANTSRFQ